MGKVVDEIDHGRNRIRDLKRQRALRCATYLAGLVRGRKTLTGRKKGLTVSADRYSIGNRCGCCSGKTLINNYLNFHKSELPKRLMFFSKGEWIDFPHHAINPLVNAFGGKRSAVEVVLDGCLCLIDFLCMVRVNLKNGGRQSIAWIDESGCCFFPKYFFDGSDIKDGMSRNSPEIMLKLEIDISAEGSSETQDESNLSVSHEKIVKAEHFPIADDHSDMDQNSGASQTRKGKMKQGSAENGENFPEGGSSGRGVSDTVEMPKIFGSEVLPDKLVSLDRDSSDYIAVQDVFLMGLDSFVTASHIVGIYRYPPTSSSSHVRMQLFASQAHALKNYRGDANLRYAWYGSSKEDIVQIMLHGFGKIRKPVNGALYGNGIYLSPKECSRTSAVYSDVDEKGVQHMVLCRVIMGNMEQVSFGSEQFCPSDENFDSGVDDIRDPKHYIVWGTHMNTHILPEYVVSFKVPISLQEYWAGLKESQSTFGSVSVNNSRLLDDHVKSVAPTAHLGKAAEAVERPNSNWMPFPLLFAVIDKHISRSTRKRIDTYYDAFKGKAAEAVERPNSNWMPFPLLFAVIDKHISRSTRKRIDTYYDAFKSKRMTRSDLIKRFRLLVGDDLLIATLKNLQSFAVNLEMMVKFPSGVQVSCLGARLGTVDLL